MILSYNPVVTIWMKRVTNEQQEEDSDWNENGNGESNAFTAGRGQIEGEHGTEWQGCTGYEHVDDVVQGLATEYKGVLKAHIIWKLNKLCPLSHSWKKLYSCSYTAIEI